jgi:thiol-disulfide isomerase/thioredoxin
MERTRQQTLQRTMRTMRLAQWATIFAIAVGMGTQGAGAASTGVKAPAFDVVTLAGERYTHATMEGHPTLLVFWAPWCKVCQRELPALGEYSEREKPAQLRVLSIGFADTRERVESFVKAREATVTFPTAYDEDNRMARDYRINATPTFVLVDAQGQVVMIHRGGGLLGNVQFREFVSTLKG